MPPPYRTLREIVALNARGDLPGADPKWTEEELLRNAGERMRREIATLMQIPPERITECELLDVDEHMPGKIQIHLKFNPKLTLAERKRLGVVLRAWAALRGSRPPVFPGQG